MTEARSELIIRGFRSDHLGHSLSGAVTQMLLNRGLGSVGGGVSAATVKGVRDLPSPPCESRALPSSRSRAEIPSAKKFHYAFANTMSEEESKPLWER